MRGGHHQTSALHVIDDNVLDLIADLIQPRNDKAQLLIDRMGGDKSDRIAIAVAIAVAVEIGDATVQETLAFLIFGGDARADLPQLVRVLVDIGQGIIGVGVNSGAPLTSSDRKADRADRSRVAASSRSRCGGLCGQRDFQMHCQAGARC
jgi:hypothetical protein